jgi:hypothetical protein
MRASRILLPFGVVALSAVCASGAHRAKMVVRDYSGAQTFAYVSALTFTPSALHVDTHTFSGSETAAALIYRMDQHKIWHVEHGDTSYVEINEKAMALLSTGVNKAIEVMDALFGEEEASDPPALASRPTGATRQVLGITCREFEITRGGLRVQTVWLASWASVGLSPERFAAVRGLARSSDQVLAALAAAPLLEGVPEVPLSGVAGLDGYPVLIRHYEGGRVMYDILLHVPETADIGPDLFQVAPGYRRRLL